jgi:predicted Zn finger-like uncharacterized protein
MNFLCDQCKQKYHVADEKVRGRAVTRFKCKKCEHVIEIRTGGDADADAGSGPVEELSTAREIPASIPPPAATPVPRPTVPRPTTGSTGVPRPSTNSSLPTAAARAASSSLPGRPATGVGLSTSAANAASAARPSPTAPPRPTPAAPPRPTTSSSLPAAKSIPSRPSAPSPLRSSLSPRAEEPKKPATNASALLNATETGWYAGVRDVPVGPLTRSELAIKIEAGDITPDSLVWREGLNDWRPLRDVEELGDLLRQAGERMSGGLLGTMGRKAPTANVVPIAQARPAVRPGFESPESDGPEPAGDDEPTRMTSLAELIATSEAGNRTSAPAPAPAPAPARVSMEPPARAAMEPPPPARASMEPAATPRASMEPAAPARISMEPAAASPVVAPAVFEPVPAPKAAPVAPVSPAALVASSEPTMDIEPAAPFVLGPTTPAASTPQPAPLVATPRETKQGRLPVGVWVMMAGVGALGIAVGVVFRPAAPPPSPSAPVQAPAPPAAVEQPGVRTVGAEIHLPTEEPTPAAPIPPPAPPVVAPTPTPAPSRPAERARASTGGSSNGGSSGSGSAAGGASRGGLSAAQLAMMNAQLGGGGSAGVTGGSGPAPTTLRTAPQAESGGGLSGAARAGQVVEMLQRSNAVGSCWNSATRRNPAHPRESIRVQLDVNSAGRATAVRVNGADDPDLSTCIQQRARGQFYGAGGQVTAEASFNLTTGS